MSSTPSIVVEDVHKNFRLRHTHSIKETFLAATRRKPLTSDFHALDGVSFDVGQGEAVALLGFNGSGKSTLLKLISGVLSPDKGRVLTRGRVAGLIEVGAGFHPDLSGRENIFLNAAILGMSRKETQARFDEIVAFSEIGPFIDTEVKHYSSGMFLRLAFSVAIHTEVDILLIDEILSVGDEPFQKKCLARIRELHALGKTLVVVSHDLAMVSRLCQRGVVLQDGKVVFDGASSVAVKKLRTLSRSPFVDVPGEHPSFGEIVRLADSQILPTTSEDDGARLFHLQEPVTWGTMARAFRLLAATTTPNGTSLVTDTPDVSDQAALSWLLGGENGARSAGVDAAAVITRGEMAETLHRRAAPDWDPSEGEGFGDVDESHPAFSAISWLRATGIATGWDVGRERPEFRPDLPLTREALVVLLTRFLALGAR